MTTRTTILALTLCTLLASTAQAGARLEINDDAWIDLGFRLQLIARQTQTDLDGDGSFETVQDLLVRRGRFSLRGAVNEKVSCYLQTAINSPVDDQGRSMRTTDARVEYTARPWARFYMGLHKAPTSRQELTPASCRVAIDRPGLAGKVLNRKGGVLAGFATSSYADGEAGIKGDEGVRDIGVTMFGSHPLAERIHLKYYLGAYDGIQVETSDAERLTGRLQLNFGDAEPGFANRSYYLGDKQTVSVGLSYDKQQNVALAAGGGDIDYAMLSADVFVERRLDDGVLTIEGAYTTLDFEDGVRLVTPADGPTSAITLDLRQSQGDGWFTQAGYLIDNVWQPWAEYETWTSDATDGTGGYTAWRAGVAYYLEGNHAHLKAGLERFTPEVPFSSTEDTRVSAVCALFLTY